MHFLQCCGDTDITTPRQVKISAELRVKQETWLHPSTPQGNNPSGFGNSNAHNSAIQSSCQSRAASCLSLELPGRRWGSRVARKAVL